MDSIQYNQQLCLAILHASKADYADALNHLAKAQLILKNRQEPYAYKGVIMLIESQFQNNEDLQKAHIQAAID